MKGAWVGRQRDHMAALPFHIEMVHCWKRRLVVVGTYVSSILRSTYSFTTADSAWLPKHLKEEKRCLEPRKQSTEVNTADWRTTNSHLSKETVDKGKCDVKPTQHLGLGLHQSLCESARPCPAPARHAFTF